jgi:hypothetical protein
MDYFKPRKLIFKAWNRDAKLLMRLGNIDCKRGELFKKDHIILQFTGLHDKHGDEIFEMDIVMIGSEKYLIRWDDERNGWVIAKLSSPVTGEPFLKSTAEKTARLWSYFEAEHKS